MIWLSIISCSFSLETLSEMTPVIQEVIRTHLLDWQARRDVYAYPECKLMAFTLAACSLVGLDITSARKSGMHRTFVDFLENMMTLPFNIPGFGFRKVSYGTITICKTMSGHTYIPYNYFTIEFVHQANAAWIRCKLYHLFIVVIAKLVPAANSPECTLKRELELRRRNRLGNAGIQYTCIVYTPHMSLCQSVCTVSHETWWLCAWQGVCWSRRHMEISQQPHVYSEA